MDSCCGYVAMIFKQCTDKELAAKLGVDINISPQDEERLKQEYPWVLNNPSEPTTGSRGAL